MIQQFYLWVYILQKLKARTQADTCTTVFIAELFMTPKGGNNQHVPHRRNGSTERGPSTQGILFCLKKEGHSDTCYNTDEPWRHYVKWNKPATKGQILYNSTCVRYLRVVRYIDKMVIPRGSGWRKGELVWGTKFQFVKTKTFWKRIAVMTAQQSKCI